ncbi:MAG TPA: ribosome maturation factor RimP [Smithellaceae bacterium]|nr:ribosome maturation factor RimP [Smithellaceae bacterium]
MNDELKEKIRHLAEPVIAAEGMELIHVECLKMHARWIIRLYLDKEGGVNLDDCSAVSGQLADILDVNDLMRGPYTLEVSSPGLDRPISRNQDFLKYKGCKVNVKTVAKIEGVKNFHGTIVDLLEENGRKIVVVDVAGKLYNIPMVEIAKANLAAVV